MRISEIYTKEIVLREFWNGVEKDLVINEAADSNLSSLIGQANDIIFEKFKINPKERKYSIVGSARLYLYPTLREAFGLSGTIGDLDMVIPNKEDWVNAGLEANWDKGGLYRPTDDESIEAFNVWDPSKAGEKYADVSVRSTNDVVRDSTNIKGYFFMSIADIMDYKTSLNREKEKEIVDLVNAYQQSGSNNKNEFLRKIVGLIGKKDAREFLGTVKEGEIKGPSKIVSVNYLKGLLKNVHNNLAKEFLTNWILKGINNKVKLSSREYTILDIIKRGGIIPKNFTTKN